MEIEIMKTVRETVNIEDGFYSLEYTPDEGFVSQCSIKGDKAMTISKDLEIGFSSTRSIAQNFHMVKQSDDTEFRIALQNLASRIENFY